MKEPQPLDPDYGEGWVNPVEQAFPPPPEIERTLTLERENTRLRADLILANQRIAALEARIQRQMKKGGW